MPAGETSRDLNTGIYGFERDLRLDNLSKSLVLHREKKLA